VHHSLTTENVYRGKQGVAREKVSIVCRRKRKVFAEGQLRREGHLRVGKKVRLERR